MDGSLLGDMAMTTCEGIARNDDGRFLASSSVNNSNKGGSRVGLNYNTLA